MKKIYIILAVITVIIVITVITSRKPTTNYQQPFGSAQGKPTAVPIPTKITINQLPTTNYQKRNNATIPATYTGVAEDQNIPKADTDLATQKRELRLKTPLTSPEFTISFDFANDVFDVALIPPITQNKVVFEAWAAANYPLIPMDRFSIK